MYGGVYGGGVTASGWLPAVVMCAWGGVTKGSGWLSVVVTMPGGCR